MEDFKLVEFKNGFKAILYPKKGLYSTALSLYIRAGHCFEDKNTLGLSHFCEHMIFKGTASHPTIKLLNLYQDELAFHPEAFTGVDEVNINGVCPRDNFYQSLKHLIELVFESEFKDENIEKERQVIMEEFLRRRDNPDVYLWDETMKSRFKGETSVIGRSIVETVENVKVASPEQIREFYRSFFVPSRMVLGLAGDFDLKKTTQILKEHFDKAPLGSKYYPKLNIQDASKKVVMKFDHSAGKVYLQISWPVFDDIKDLKIALTFNLLRVILQRRIFDILRQDLGAVYDLSIGGFGAFEEVIVLNLHTSFDPTKTNIVFEVITQEINKVLAEKVPEEELAQHIRRLNQTSPMSFDYLTSALNWITQDIYTSNRVDLPDECIKVRNTITPKDIQNLCKKIFNPEYIHISAIGPITEKELEKFSLPLQK